MTGDHHIIRSYGLACAIERCPYPEEINAKKISSRLNKGNKDLTGQVGQAGFTGFSFRLRRDALSVEGLSILLILLILPNGYMTFVQNVHNLILNVDFNFWTPQYHLPELRGRRITISGQYSCEF